MERRLYHFVPMVESIESNREILIVLISDDDRKCELIFFVLGF